MFNKDQLAALAKQQAQDIAVTGKFMGLMGFGQPLQGGAVSFSGQYDSLVANAAEQNINVASFVPAALLSLQEKINDKANFGKLLDSIGTGVTAHRNRHGGDMPSAALVASALSNAALLHDGLSSSATGGLYDSASVNGAAAKEFFMDSVSSHNSAHAAEVPTLAMVTIATTIANAMPIVSYLPNPKGSQTVPMVYVRQVANRDYGQTLKGDFLDGEKAANQYFDSVHRLELTSADQTTFTVKAHRCVEPGTLTPDATSGRLPLVAGATTINVGGLAFAGDEQTHATSGSTTGKLSVLAFDQDGVTLNGVAYKLISGYVDLDKDEVSITLDKALPADVKVIANVVANYEAKDANSNFILVPPGVEAKIEYQSVTARAIRAIYTASIDAITQMQNELGVDMRAAFVAVVIAKLMFEQNCRLLAEAKDRAVGIGSVRELDLSRGSSMTVAFNKTSDIASEIIPAVEEQKRRMIEDTAHAPSGFDVYVTGSLSTLMRSLADDTNFVPSGITLGAPNSMVRLGSRGTDNYYYLPSNAGVLDEGEDIIDVGGVDTVVTFAEMMMIARNEVAAKSMFLGHVAVPVVTGDVQAVAFEQGVTFYTRQAAELNKNKRFGRQSSVLRILNLPKSMTTAVTP
ncbi:hypothetical protein J2X86_002450 [Acinetobacter lwoffii]|jgi:hypothetical protein|uniref:Capsid protein n=1 Tax=Acinetobacter lwoffii TaxID=28090 RepID=A0AAW8LKP7_ACILW|nr:hypothetical protein [Acinetobacter lwoffii]MDR6630395.1 hypothetical protein [Acinetobacter lwoffii]